MTKKNSLAVLLPVMLCFFTMGFVDLVGIASNYVQKDLGLSDAKANMMPSLVFFWFLIFSVPTGVLMNRIGRKKTVLLSIIVTAVSLLLPIFGNSYPLMLISFSLLGIGNALMQTSLNPLISNIVNPDRLASTLTFGQFVKAIASFLAPYIAIWGAVQAIPSFGLGWRVLFPIYMVIAVIAIFALSSTKIEEERDNLLVASKLCNRQYEGEIKQVGDKVKINGVSRPTISDYDDVTGLGEMERPKDQSTLLEITEQKAFHLSGRLGGQLPLLRDAPLGAQTDGTAVLGG